MRVRLSGGTILPVAPIRVNMLSAPGDPRMQLKQTGDTEMELITNAAHVGLLQADVGPCEIQDLLGLFTLTLHPRV